MSRESGLSRALAVIVFVCALLPVTAWAQGFTLSGTVYGGGTPLANTTVEALTDGTTSVVASVDTNGSGQYALTLLDGTYDLRVSPPTGSGFGQETIQNITISGANRSYDVILLSTGGSLSGTIRGRGGNPLPDVNITVYNTSWQYLGSGHTDTSGHYSVLASGAVILSMSGNASADAPSWYLYRYGLVINGPTVANIDLPVVELTGTVKSESDAVIGGATINASSNSYEYDGTIQTSAGSSANATAAADGTYALLLLAGSAQFNVFPPQGNTSYSPVTENLTLSGDTAHDFVLPAPSPLTGTIRGRDGNPLPNVNITVYSSNWQYLGSAQTDVDGHYSVLATGPVILSMSGGATSNSPNWYMYRYGVVLNGAMTMDVDLPVVEVTGVVKNESGDPISVATINASSSSYTYDGTIQTSAGSSISVATDADGTYRLLLLAGNGQFNVFPPAGSTSYSPLSAYVDLAADTSHDFVLPSPSPLTGTIRGWGGNPLANVNITVYNNSWQYLASTQTDADGHYTVLATGPVILSLSGNRSENSPGWYMYRYGMVLDGATTMDVDLDVVRITGSTTDSNGAGIASVQLSGSSSSYLYDGTIQTSMGSSNSVDTAADGSYSMMLLAGSGQFNIYPPSQSGFQPVTLNPQLSDDLTQRIILQQADLTAPLIVAGPVVVHLSDTSVSISWTTNEAATSRVEYGIGSLSSSINDQALTTNHEVTLLNLLESSTYQFRVGSTDKAGNGPTWSSIGTFATQGSPGDVTAPHIISGPTVSAVDQTTAIIEWTTDEPATTSISFGTDSSLGSSASGAPGRFTQTHSIRLTGLTAETTYFAQVHSADPDANAVSSSIFTFTTLAVPDTTAPAIIAGPTVTSKSDTTMVVSWTTDEPATSGVSYNDGTHYGVVSDPALTTQHQITMSGLTPATLYSITVSSTDAAGNGPTLGGPIAETTDATPDTTAPAISNVLVSDITVRSAVISWSTDEASSSTVRYGIVAGSPDGVRADVTSVMQHQMTVTGLEEGTRYYFVVSSTDSSANTASSDELDFTTLSTHVDQPPSAPGPITAPLLTRASSFDVSWGSSTDDIALASYEVLRNGEVIATEPPSSTSFTDSGMGEGSYQYQIRATDSAGHTAVSDVFTVVVDRTAPVIDVADVDVEATGAATPVSFPASATDNVDVSASVSCMPASGSAFAVGATEVTCTSSDLAGNQSSATFTVTVSDTTAPQVNVPATVTREATGPDGTSVDFTSSAVDLVDGAIVATCEPPSGSTFGVGTTTVVCKATDAAGNEGSSSFDVVVVDTRPPVVTVPADLTLEAEGPGGAVATFAASGNDIVSGAVAASCDPAAGSLFRLGSTLVTCTALDAAGNAGSATFTVLVRDTTAPVVNVPADMTVEATGAGGANAIYTVSVTDAVSSGLTATCSPASGSLFGIGATTVSCSATDGAGNTGHASFGVTVADTTAPSIASVQPSQSVLWPPNHQMVALTLSVVASDAVDPAPVCSIANIASNESINGLGDGDTAPDWAIGNGVSFQLRAERSAKGPGRVYTITAQCRDSFGNASTRSTVVSVPLNKK